METLFDTPGSTLEGTLSASPAADILELVLGSLQTDYGFGRQLLRSLPAGAHWNLSKHHLIAISDPQDPPFAAVLIGTADHGPTAQDADALLDEHINLEVVGYAAGDKCGFRRRNWRSGTNEHVADLSPALRPTPRAVLRAGANEAQCLLPLRESMADVFFEIHCHLRSDDGLHPEAALDEVCKILFAKLYDELHTSSGMPYTFQSACSPSADDVAARIRRLYRSGAKLSQPGIFTAPLQMSGASIYRVVKTLETYSLSATGGDLAGRMFQRILGPDVRQSMGQYFTPEPVADLMVRLLDPRPGERLIDPFCGSGHLLTQSRDHAYSNPSADQSPVLPMVLDGIDQSPLMLRIAAVSALLHSGRSLHLQRADALDDLRNLEDVQPGAYDAVVTNPPFGSLLRADSDARLVHFELANNTSRGRAQRAVPLEWLGLERSLTLLRPGGRMAVVVPNSVLSNKGAAVLRQWLAQLAKVRAVISLPASAFIEHGAQIQASVLLLRKQRVDEQIPAEYPIFMGVVESQPAPTAGYQVFPDTDSLVKGFSHFISQRGW